MLLSNELAADMVSGGLIVGDHLLYPTVNGPGEISVVQQLGRCQVHLYVAHWVSPVWPRHSNKHTYNVLNY